jgi:hypothetical protein
VLPWELKHFQLFFFFIKTCRKIIWTLIEVFLQPQNFRKIFHQIILKFCPLKVALLNPSKLGSLRLGSHCSILKSVIVLVRLMSRHFLWLT